jgi:hypothetical protein
MDVAERRAYKKAWNKANPDKVRAYCSAYRKRNAAKVNAYNRKYRLEHHTEFRRKRRESDAKVQDRIRQQRRANYARHAADYRAERAAYRRKFPEKARARALVRYHVLKGKIQRKPCEQCGLPAQAHHDDYSRPLDVRWLCPSHHSLFHVQQKV